MAFPSQLLISMGVKVAIVILTIVTLILLDPAYVTAYISINYEIVIIYLVSALTLLYCIVSVLMSFLLAKRGEDTPLTNCAFSEIIFATGGIMGWLIIIGIGGTISQRTIIETGERFGWIGAMAGLNVGCFLIIAAIFAANVVSEKILQRQSRLQKYDRGVYVQ
uniref:MARVEL domain-containing protein n=1 Tax=Caenorhabditis tropicalis TaxID=1561998 RepID=A0A1I7UPG2_9PELO